MELEGLSDFVRRHVLEFVEPEMIFMLGCRTVFAGMCFLVYFTGFQALEQCFLQIVILFHESSCDVGLGKIPVVREEHPEFETVQ